MGEPFTIKLENLGQILAAGAKRVVIVSGILQAHDPTAYAAGVKKILSSRRGD